MLQQTSIMLVLNQDQVMHFEEETLKQYKKIPQLINH